MLNMASKTVWDSKIIQGEHKKTKNTFKWNLNLSFSIFCSDESNYVQSSMFDRSKAKIGCSSSISNKWTRSSSFDVRKNDVRVSSMSNLVNLVKALLGSMFVRSKPKIGCSSSITNRWTRSSSFDVRKMMFEFDRCSIKWCSTHH